MSTLFAELAARLAAGHARDVGPLYTDHRLPAEAAQAPAEAAVLVAVTDRPQPGVLLTQRPATMRDHPGQVAFPGGKLDPGEDAVAAALREGWEELALDPAAVRVVGISDRYVTGTGFAITPVLAVVPPDLPLVPHPREVESWFEAPLARLMDPMAWTQNSVFWKGAERQYLEMEHGGYRIWGVTAAIAANLARRLGYAEARAGASA